MQTIKAKNGRELARGDRVLVFNGAQVFMCAVIDIMQPTPDSPQPSAIVAPVASCIAAQGGAMIHIDDVMNAGDSSGGLIIHPFKR